MCLCEPINNNNAPFLTHVSKRNRFSSKPMVECVEQKRLSRHNGKRTIWSLLMYWEREFSNKKTVQSYKQYGFIDVLTRLMCWTVWLNNNLTKITEVLLRFWIRFQSRFIDSSFSINKTAHRELLFQFHWLLFVQNGFDLKSVSKMRNTVSFVIKEPLKSIFSFI